MKVGPCWRPCHTGLPRNTAKPAEKPETSHWIHSVPSLQTWIHPAQAIALMTYGYAGHRILHQCHSGVDNVCQLVECFMVEGFFVNNLETYIPTLQSVSSENRDPIASIVCQSSTSGLSSLSFLSILHPFCQTPNETPFSIPHFFTWSHLHYFFCIFFMYLFLV